MGFNFLSYSTEYLTFAVEKIKSIDLNWIGRIISWIFDLFSDYTGGVVLGAIIFTLILKTIVLPLDIFSRVKMKKQSLMMEEMRPQMEKLQQQYAGDKAMYSQKVMELQKQYGFSPIGACLPTLISIVIFMIVFSAFSTYSNYAMLNNYNDMVDAYSQSVSVYVITDSQTEGRFLIGENYKYIVDYDKFEEVFNKDYAEKMVDADVESSEIKELMAMKTQFDEGKTALANGESNAEAQLNEVVTYFVRQNARAAAAKYYREENKDTHFLWIGNMWYPDSMLNKEVPQFSNFSSAVQRAVGTGLTATYEEDYNEVTYNLMNVRDPANPSAKPEGQRYNGYFVLVILSIGLMFLQQWIMMRTQKASTELSSVDGSAAKTNKIMMIMMPLMFGVFAFFYSAAFSTYMIVNTAYGLVSTLIINKLVAVRFAKVGLKPKKYKTAAPTNRKRLK